MHEDPNRVFGPEDDEDEEDENLIWIWKGPTRLTQRASECGSRSSQDATSAAASHPKVRCDPGCVRTLWGRPRWSVGQAV